MNRSKEERLKNHLNNHRVIPNKPMKLKQM